jgi:hypothetical protein
MTRRRSGSGIGLPVAAGMTTELEAYNALAPPQSTGWLNTIRSLVAIVEPVPIEPVDFSAWPQPAARADSMQRPSRR